MAAYLVPMTQVPPLLTTKKPGTTLDPELDLEYVITFTFLACNCEAVTHAIVIDFLSVRPSVCLSVCLSNACIVTKRKHLAKKLNYD